MSDNQCNIVIFNNNIIDKRTKYDEEKRKVVILGIQNLLHPFVYFKCLKKGKIKIGNNNIFEERVQIINDSDEDMEIGSYNIFKCKTNIKNTNIGNFNTFGINTNICNNSIKNSNYIGDNTILPTKIVLDSKTIMSNEIIKDNKSMSTEDIKNTIKFYFKIYFEKMKVKK